MKMDLRNDPRTLSMMEVIPRPKPRELSEAEKWYVTAMANARNFQQGYLQGMRAMTDAEMAEAHRKGFLGYMMNGHASQQQKPGASIWDGLFGGVL